MSKLKRMLVAVSLAVFATGANATIIDFIDLTENSTTGLGESAWETLSWNDGISGGLTLNITGNATNDDDSKQYAYLDWNNGGLGVCKDLQTGASPGASLGGTSNKCAPGNDDNTTEGEYLSFVFNKKVEIQNFWFNNNHDGGFDSLVDLITIAGTAYPVSTGITGDSTNGIGPFLVDAGTTLDVGYNNQQFYVSGMEFKFYIPPDSGTSEVPEPIAISMIGLGLLGFGLAAVRRRI